MSRRTWLHQWLLIAALAVLAMLAEPAGAQSSNDLARARELYNQGLTQEAAGDWAGALATFQNVAKIKMSPQVRFHIARSKEHLGRLNEALGGYRLAEYEAAQLGARSQELVAEVQSARENLEARIPKLVIVRGRGSATARIELDGVVLGESQIGTEIRADPGPHVIAGTVADGRRFMQTVDLVEGETKRVELIAPDEQPPPAEVKPPSSAASQPTAPPSAPVAIERSGSALPWVIGGVGVASLVLSAVFYTQKSSAESDLKAGCLGKTCPDTLQSTQDRGETYARLTGVTLGVGVVAIGVAAVMLLTGRAVEPAPQTGWTMTVRPHAGAAGIDLGARF
jgi:hypothetical protein